MSELIAPKGIAQVGSAYIRKQIASALAFLIIVGLDDGADSAPEAKKARRTIS